MSLNVRFYLFCLVVVLFAGACNDDEISVSSEPGLDLTTEISGLPGETITFTGLLSDPAGIDEIRIVYEPWFLDKIIEVDPGITQFDLAYSFLIPADEVLGSEHVVSITATNPGDNSTASTVRVTISGDNTNPSISISSPNDGATSIIGSGPEFDLVFDVTDDQGIATVSVVGFGINETIEVNDVSYSFSRPIDFVFSGPASVEITVTDQAGNVTSATRSVAIEASLRFTSMFLADVATDAELNAAVFGVPIRIDGADDPANEGVEFVATYYNRTANQEIRFIPQRTSFAPFAFGAGAEPGELAIGTDASVAPIVLPDVGYYRIVINFTSLSYTLEPFTPTAATYDFINLIGTGVTVNDQNTCVSNADGTELCYNFGSGKPLTVDPNNPYLFTAEVELFDFDPVGAGNNGFILNSNPGGWSPFWRFDAGDAVGLFPDRAVLNGGFNFIFGPEVYGEYTFEFDTFTEAVKMVPR